MSIERPKTKKNSAAKMSRKLKKRSSIWSRTDVSESTIPAIRAPIASERPSSSATAAQPTRNREHREQEELERQPVERAVEWPRKPPRGCEPDRDEPERLGDEDERVRRPTAARSREAEHERDDEILEHEDRQHEVGLVVAQPAEVDQPLDGDRARGHVDARSQDERREAPAEGDHAHDEPEPEVGDEVDVPPRPMWRPVDRSRARLNSSPRKKSRKTSPSSARKSVTSDGLMSASSRGSFGPEQDAREQVRRDRRQTEPARHEPQRPEDDDGDRELGERHADILAARVPLTAEQAVEEAPARRRPRPEIPRRRRAPASSSCSGMGLGSAPPGGSATGAGSGSASEIGSGTGSGTSDSGSGTSVSGSSSGSGIGLAHELLAATPLGEALEVAPDGGAHVVEVALLPHASDRSRRDRRLLQHGLSGLRYLGLANVATHTAVSGSPKTPSARTRTCRCRGSSTQDVRAVTGRCEPATPPPRAA